MPLFVFPEGGRTPRRAKLQPFLSGAAYLAIRAQVPLVPIALSGVYDLLPIHTRHFYPSKLTLRAGEPIETKGMTVRQTGELTERLRAAIEEMLGQPAQSRGRSFRARLLKLRDFCRCRCCARAHPTRRC